MDLWRRGWRWAGTTMLLVSLVGSGGCIKKPPVSGGPALAEDVLLTQVRARTVPNPTQARFSVKLDSRPLNITAPPLGGGLIVDRPGRAWLTILTPLGTPVFTVASDGDSVSLVNSHDKQFVHADDAQQALMGVTGGQVALDDVFAMLLGLVPIDPARVRSRAVVEGGIEFVADGPAGTVLTAVVHESLATPVRVTVGSSAGKTLVVATYEPFELVEATLLPTRVTIVVEAVALTIDVRFKTWTSPEVVPEVFNPEAPDGFLVLTFEEYGALMKERQAARKP